MQTITTWLWFDTQAEDAAKHYTSIFPNSQILEITHYNDAMPERNGQVMTVSFELDGKEFVGLNGGPEFTFDEAISFQVLCKDQAELDHYWTKLGEGGEEGPCGWLKDRFGLSWQIVPTRLYELIADGNSPGAVAATKAMLGMKKLDIAPLEAAAEAAG
jgi:predicted 3-demethylubiquinone-9 3-methyltransferase (glyoxalase superfamily)